MKQYVIDEIRPDDFEKLNIFFKENYSSSAMDGLYWIPLELEILSNVQISHKQCQPYYFAIELQGDRLSCELLVRTQQKIRCDCIQYATEVQRNWLINSVDAIFEKLGLMT